jgi:hypothetical protein
MGHLQMDVTEKTYLPKLSDEESKAEKRSDV